jgi:hypothetical protein
MRSDDRYGRQALVLGARGQARVRALEVEVRGVGLGAEVCALYLAGAGVRRLAVAPSIVARVQALSTEVIVEGSSAPRGGLELECLGAEKRFDDPDPLLAGAAAARWALAKAVNEGAP